MKAKLTRYTWIISGLMLSLALSATIALAQEEVAEEAVAAGGGSIGMVIAILGVGVLVVFGLGAAMNAQANEEKSANE